MLLTLRKPKQIVYVSYVLTDSGKRVDVRDHAKDFEPLHISKQVSHWGLWSLGKIAESLWTRPQACNQFWDLLRAQWWEMTSTEEIVYKSKLGVPWEKPLYAAKSSLFPKGFGSLDTRSRTQRDLTVRQQERDKKKKS